MAAQTDVTINGKRLLLSNLDKVLRDFFEHHKLQGLPKTSGSKGLQVYVPLNTPVSFEQTKTCARRVAEILTEQHPDKVLFRMEKRLRQNKVFVDWSQNDRHKTTVCVYSLRAKERPTVSTPLKWSELEWALERKDSDSLSFDAEQVIERVDDLGDLFKPVLHLRQKLPALS